MKKNLLLLLSILALSCTSDDETSNSDMKLVTGVTFRQNPDDTPFQLGNPNTLINGKFVMYPNPAINTAFIAATENVSDVWIVPANAKKSYQNTDFGSILNNSLYSEQSIIQNSDYSLNGQAASGISLDVSSLDEGYYRVFVKIDGQIYWDNLYKNDSGSSEEEITALINFWD